MFFVKKIDIADNERAFLFEKNRFAGVLEPGRYHYFDLFGNIRVESYDLTQYELKHNLSKFLVSTFHDLTRDYLIAYQLGNNEIGLLYLDGQLVEIIAPGSFKVYWRGPEECELKRIDITEDFQMSKILLKLLGHGHNQILSRQAAQSVYYTEVEDSHVGLLMVNGKFEQILPSGSYGFWKYTRNVVVKHIDL